MLSSDRLPSVTQHSLDRGGGFAVAYRDYQPNAAPVATVVLVHGLASFGKQFDSDARYFAACGYRVLVPDLRGHGASVTTPVFTPDSFSISVMADDILAVLDHAGAAAVHWVGNSLGGILALSLLGTPSAKRLTTLTLFGTCLSMDLPRSASMALRVALLPGRAVTGALTARATTRSVIGRALIRQAMAQFNIDAGAAIASHVRRYDFLEQIRGFGRPLLILWGGQDHAVNLRLGADLQRLEPNRFRRVDLSTGGHCANFDCPDEFRAALLAHWHNE